MMNNGLTGSVKFTLSVSLTTDAAVKQELNEQLK